MERVLQTPTDTPAQAADREIAIGDYLRDNPGCEHIADALRLLSFEDMVRMLCLRLAILRDKRYLERPERFIRCPRCEDHRHVQAGEVYVPCGCNPIQTDHDWRAYQATRRTKKRTYEPRYEED